MDVSPEYVKMCGCEEIQGSWKIKYGDYFATDWFVDQEDNIGKVCMGLCATFDEQEQLISTSDNPDIRWFKPACSWLPRQDQLQEMVEDQRLDIMLDNLHDFCQSIYCGFKDEEFESKET